MRLTEFEENLLWIVGANMGFVVMITFDIPTIFTGAGWVVSIYLHIMWSAGPIGHFADSYPIKYKFVKRRRRYHAYVLRPLWYFIIWWRPVKKKSHSYKSQNIFGAKTREYYSTEVTFKHPAEAKQAIEEHKAQTRRNRTELFQRPPKPKKGENESTYIDS